MADRTTIRLPEELVRRAKGRAAAEGRSLTALIEDGVRRVLDDMASGTTTIRVLPPVSSQAGGLMHGIDLDDWAIVQDMDDFARPE